MTKFVKEAIVGAGAGVGAVEGAGVWAVEEVGVEAGSWSVWEW